MGLVESALHELPEAHRTLWLRARLIVKLAASRHYVEGHPMNEVLAVIAEPGTVAEAVMRFFGVYVVEPATKSEPLIAVLDGDAARRLLMNFPGASGAGVGLPKAAFLVLTAPYGARPGLSVCRVIERARLS